MRFHKADFHYVLLLLLTFLLIIKTTYDLKHNHKTEAVDDVFESADLILSENDK